MAINGTVTINLSFSGDLIGSFTQTSPIGFINPAAAGLEQTFTFTGAGANTVTVPAQGAIPNAVIIIPPPGNTQGITFKGVTGDTGVLMHPTYPSVFTLGSGVTSFVLTVAGTVTGIKFIWI